ncbi:MAG: SAM-dependent chlorinase/fluorinase [Gammaproteobacteria bacterium]|nr:SAM-dependent chlorinase/fluorinase [Gammaproteobacteria bacterium]
MIILFTDFGVASPYVGQMKAVLLADSVDSSNTTIIELFSDAPSYNPKASAYLLSAFVDEFPLDSVFLCVVDPGVGSDRRPIVMRANGRWFVGPDNGLFNVIASRSHSVKFWEITWKPTGLSSSFHGRDLFAPVAACLARNEAPPGVELEKSEVINTDWPDDLAECIYIDHFGNVITGIRAQSLLEDEQIVINNHPFCKARTFSDVPSGTAFYYENANGLVELAINQGHAANQLNIKLGEKIKIVKK